MRTRTLLTALPLWLAAPLLTAAASPNPGPCYSPLLPGKVFLTVPEALELAFPGCEVERGTVFLTDAQKKEIHELAEVDVDLAIVHPYVATRQGERVGTAYFDTHRVRSLRETVMVVVTPAGTIDRIEVLAFGEPLDYLPRETWYAQFPGKRLDAELRLKRGIKGVTGATLTARSTTDAARRSLAVHAVLNEPPPPPPSSREGRD